jgi:hypothetical protein
MRCEVAKFCEHFVLNLHGEETRVGGDDEWKTYERNSSVG